MADQPELSEELSAKLDELVDRIAAGHEFPDDVRRELRAHLEDKAEAYLSGAQRLGEADVLLLVEKHFGDVVQVRALLRQADGGENPQLPSVQVGVGAFFRRLAAVVVAGVVASFAWQISLFWASRVGFSPEIADYSAASAIATVVLVLLLDRWATRIERGFTPVPWFSRLAPRHVLMVVSIALSIRWIVPMISIGNSHGMPSGDYGVDRSAITTVLMTRLAVQLIALVYLFRWIIWRGTTRADSWTRIGPALAAGMIAVCAGGFIGPVWSMTQIIGHTPEWNFHAFPPVPAMQIWLSGIPHVPALMAICVLGIYSLVASRIPGIHSRLRHA